MPKLGCPSEYKRGPDVASKSYRTQKRYAEDISHQLRLNSFLIERQNIQSRSEETGPTPPESEPVSETPSTTSTPRSESPPPIVLCIRSASIFSTPSDHNDSNEIIADRGPDSDDNVPAEAEYDPNDWDHILDEMLDVETDDSRQTGHGVGDQAGTSTNVRDWRVLREQIKKDLKKKNLPLTKYNQLLIIRNFATLRIKGYKCIPASLEISRQWHEGNGNYFAQRVRALACHYQVFEQLPEETRGGRANAKSLLNDKSVQVACRMWLNEQKVGTITLKLFREVINATILASLGIQTMKPLAEWTA
ncbi:hypothetical protein EDD85DRAFT_958157 [Armillaria nabsnona]|nr:hypothetical protein EDD85DRAFT_958157 [Armillaria nabsnona]